MKNDKLATATVLVATYDGAEHALLVTPNPHTEESIRSKEDFENESFINTFVRAGDKLRWDESSGLLGKVPYRAGTFEELERHWGYSPNVN